MRSPPQLTWPSTGVLESSLAEPPVINVIAHSIPFLAHSSKTMTRASRSMVTLQPFRGTVALVGPGLDALVQQTPVPDGHSFVRSEMPYHVTFLSKDELRTLSPSITPEQALQQLREAVGDEQPSLHALGVGGHPRGRPEVYFIVVIWAKGQQLRKKLGLPPKDFHITLSKRDAHDVDKGVSSLLQDVPSGSSPELLDHLVFTLFAMGDYTGAKRFSVQLCQSTPASEKGFLRLGDAAVKLSQHKLAMLSYARAYQCSPPDDTKAQAYTLRRLSACARETEWGSVCTEWELEQLPSEISLVLLQPWSSDLRTRICVGSSEVPTLCLMPRDQLFIPPLTTRPTSEPLYKLPRFFRWLVPFRIALMSTPRNAVDIAALGSAHLGIRHVLTLTEETPLPKEWFHGATVKNTFCPVPNYNPPTIEQMDLIIKLLCSEENVPVLIHCGGGKGRAGTVAACYLAAFGFAQPPSDPTTLTQPTMSAPEAIAALRAIRPGSIETEQQEAFVSKWCSTIWKRQSIFPDVVPEPLSCPLEIDGSLDSSTNLFVFVGLPGSGKSWVARALLARDPDAWTWVSQDEAGNRSACEAAIGRSRKKGKVILDRCNTSRDDRKAWLALAAHWAVSPVCVWFDYPIDLCVPRAQNRIDHPTLPPGGRVRNAVKQMQEMFVPPTKQEGFAAVVTIRSFAAAEALVQRVSAPVDLFKFPRTAHLINLGAATDDDLISGASQLVAQAPADAHVVITEKVDGANMGFSLSADRTQVIVQNRSHYVNPASHVQFKKLGQWVETHREDLYRILDRDPYFAQRYVLFGEWLTTVHSVTYTKLPDWFLAFDLYDRTSQAWVDRGTLVSLLAGTRIRVTPVIHEGSMPSEEELKAMVQRKSQFTDGRLEGVYVKLEREGKVVGRGKVVRSDFIVGNEHWTKGILRTNQLELGEQSKHTLYTVQLTTDMFEIVSERLQAIAISLLSHKQTWQTVSGLQLSLSPLPHICGTPRSQFYVRGINMTYSIFSLGNPLLDIQVYNGEELLRKYDLKANDAILAEEKHAALYEEIVKDYKPVFVAGGAAQNAARGAAYVLPPKSVVYAGAVGDDDLAEQLKAANKREGLDEIYLVKKGEQTGACGVVITGHNRSLVTTLRAAEKFDKSHLSSPEVAPIIDAAKLFYVEGYFLTHGADSALELSKKSSEASKIFVLNLSAPFIPQFFGAQLQQILPYTDIVICNETEAAAWASATGLAQTDLDAIAKALAAQPKANAARPRIVIITHGAESTVVVTANDVENAKVYPVRALSDSEIVDTNGAGDAFAGGFIGAYVSGKSLEESVEAGHKMGAMCVQLVGPQYKWPKVDIL
ncbi:hypothetical protein BC835DRAFT_1470554 [Cytidiella melzeri]|nr:hypothetical protein BC835DRAFT_1470554 [Cytidiella melzeri]